MGAGSTKAPNAGAEFHSSTMRSPASGYESSRCGRKFPLLNLRENFGFFYVYLWTATSSRQINYSQTWELRDSSNNIAYIYWCN